MKYLIIILLLLVSCKSERINRQLRLSKKHMDRAIELGAHLDSIKTEIKATGEVEGITDKESTTAKVDTSKAVNACAELLSVYAGTSSKLKHQMDSIISANNQQNIIHKFLDKARSSGFYKLQKSICPSDSVHKSGTIAITVGKQKIQVPYTLDAWSKSGKAGYDFKIGQTDFKYVSENVQVNAAPANIPSWWQRLGSDISLFVVGVVVGIIASIIFALIKKIISLK